jgi:HEPN domain-containing protein
MMGRTRQNLGAGSCADRQLAIEPDKLSVNTQRVGRHALNRTDLQQLANDRVLDAEALLGAGRWSGAYYMSGYAIECALKSCIAKKTNLHDFPDKSAVQTSFTHNLVELLELAGLKLQLQLDMTPATNPVLAVNWQLVKDWDERARYEQKTESNARELYEAVIDPVNGVLTWIKVRW